jgi:hypothetical protein
VLPIAGTGKEAAVMGSYTHTVASGSIKVLVSFEYLVPIDDILISF